MLTQDPASPLKSELYPRFKEEQIVLSQAPQVINKISDAELTVGDLHANVNLALYIDMLHGLIDGKMQSKIPGVTNEELYLHLYQLEHIYHYLYSQRDIEAFLENCEKIKEKILKKVKADNSNNLTSYNQLTEIDKKISDAKKQLSDIKPYLVRKLEKLSNFGEVEKFQNKILNEKNTEQKIDLLKEHFKKNLNQITYTEAGKTVFTRWIGDETGDRWLNDELMLEYFIHKFESDCRYEILASNHGMKFLEAYYNNFEVKAQGPQYRSIEEFCRTFQRKTPQEQKKIKENIEKYYIPRLKALSYTLVKDEFGKNIGIMLHTHAPVPFNIIQKLASKYDVDYKDTTVDKLAATIDAVNTKFRQGLNAEFFSNEDMYWLKPEMGNGDGNFENLHPVVQLCWQRHESLYNESEGIYSLRPAELHDYKIFYSYGHDPKLSKNRKIVWLTQKAYEIFAEKTYEEKKPLIDMAEKFFTDEQKVKLTKDVGITKEQYYDFKLNIWPNLFQEQFDAKKNPQDDESSIIKAAIHYSKIIFEFIKIQTKFFIENYGISTQSQTEYNFIKELVDQTLTKFNCETDYEEKNKHVFSLDSSTGSYQQGKLEEQGPRAVCIIAKPNKSLELKKEQKNSNIYQESKNYQPGHFKLVEEEKNLPGNNKGKDNLTNNLTTTLKC